MFPSPSPFRPLLDATPDSMILVDRYERVRAFNLEAEVAFGWAEGELLGEPLSRILPTHGFPVVDLGDGPHRGGPSVQRSWSATFIARRRDGSEFPVALARRPLGPGCGAHFLVTVRDLRLWRTSRSTDVRDAQDAQGLAEARATLASIGDAVVTADTSCDVTYINRAAELLTGWHLKEAIGVPLDRVVALISEGDRQPIRDRAVRCLEEVRPIDLPDGALLIRRDGAEIPVGDSLAPVLDSLGRLRGVVLVIQDESERRRVGEKLEHEAMHDPLTDLVNRREFERRLTRVIADLRGSSGDHALLYIDLDRFKAVNDTCGHTEGDELLRRIGPRLRPCLRNRDTLARIGGDEFGILLEHCPIGQAQRIAETICAAVEQMSFRVGSRTFSLGASIGLVPLTSGRTTVARVMRVADDACYAAKAGGGSRVHLGGEAPRENGGRPGSGAVDGRRDRRTVGERQGLSLL